MPFTRACSTLHALAASAFLVLTCAAPTFAQTLSITPPGGHGIPGEIVQLPAGPDFASDVLGDPWDFEERTDWVQMLSLDGLDPTKSAWVGTPALEDGFFKGTSASTMPAVCLQFEGAANALNMGGRSGVRFPIDASKYRRLSFRVRRSATPSRGALSRLSGWLGGLGVTAGLATATLAGVWLGAVQPAGLSSVTDSVSRALGVTASLDRVDLIPSFDPFASEG